MPRERGGRDTPEFRLNRKKRLFSRNFWEIRGGFDFSEYHGLTLEETKTRESSDQTAKILCLVGTFSGATENLRQE